VDYGGRTLSIAERKPEQPGAAASEGAVTVPLRLTSSGFLSGEVQVEGIDVPLNFILDTGASVSVVSDDVASTDAFDSFERGENLRVIGAAGITEDVPSFRLPKVSLGAHSMHSITAIALDLDMINEASGFEQSGILGGNFLRNYRMTMDIKNSQVTFVPIPQK
jgi:predicted aspartyl protease